MNKSLLLGLVAALGLGALCPAQDDNRVIATSLAALRSTPDAFKNVTVRFTVQFNQLGKISNPFFTRFVPNDYVNFYAWGAEQPIWRKDAYDDTFGLLFMSKENKQLTGIYGLSTYDRVEMTGVVLNVFQGAPWIEVSAFKPVAGKVSTATLAHLYRGEDHMKRRQWSMAIGELAIAPAKDTPAEVQSAVHKNLGICYLRLGEANTAISHLSSANSLMPGGDSEAERLASAAEQKPEKELDRAVSEGGVKDAERPLWEAFEDVHPRAAVVPQSQPAGAPNPALLR